MKPTVNNMITPGITLTALYDLPDYKIEAGKEYKVYLEEGRLTINVGKWYKLNRERLPLDDLLDLKVFGL